ncbi:MAG: hypothetical protein JRI68_08295 [Deltaproteobacteria bacterium]|nr:hypothetical protein [Deltaproteobacteria bacterium]
MRLSGVLALGGLVCCTAADAAAQPTGVPPWRPQPGATPSPAPPPSVGPVHPTAPGGWGAPMPPPPNVTGAEGDSSPAAAGWLAVLSTLVPVGIGFTMTTLVERNESEGMMAGLVVVGTGAVVGPSMGHFYAGEVGHGLATAGIRLVAFGNAFGLGFLGVATMQSSQDRALGWMMLGLAGASGAGGLGLMIYDLVDAPSAARRANREDPSPRDELAAVPDITLGPAGGSLTWTF